MTPWLASLAMLSLVMSATPGPNNVIFAASGARVGALRTVPTIVGMLVGFLSVIVLCAVGIGAAVAANATAQTLLSVAASAYMLWLAWRLWSSRPSDSPSADSRQVSAVTMLFLQVLNPKVWLASVAFVSGYLGLRSPGGFWVDVLGIACFLGVVTVSATSWTIFGAAMRARLSTRGNRIFTRTLSVVAVATGIHMLRPLL